MKISKKTFKLSVLMSMLAFSSLMLCPNDSYAWGWETSSSSGSYSNGQLCVTTVESFRMFSFVWATRESTNCY